VRDSGGRILQYLKMSIVKFEEQIHSVESHNLQNGIISPEIENADFPGLEVEIRKQSRDVELFGIFTAEKILSSHPPAIKYLVEPIIPRVGVGLIVGQPDSGKSLQMNQLCIQIVAGATDFLGMPLQLTHKKALYVSTEDGIEAIRERLLRQKINAPSFDPQQLSYLIVDNCNSSSVLQKIERQIQKVPVDLVVIDGFGDIYGDGDNNSNMGMRTAVRPFSLLAQNQQTAVIFIHHINKAAYSLSPSQQHIQGGSGLAQKVRFALQLDSGKGMYRSLICVKGNYCPQGFKEKAIELELNEESLWFHQTGVKIPKQDIKTSNVKDAIKEDLIEKLLVEVLSRGKMKRVDLIKEVIQRSGKSLSTVTRKIRENLESCRFIKEGGMYSLNNVDEGNSSGTSAVIAA
jgi:hypothetical protein